MHFLMMSQSDPQEIRFILCCTMMSFNWERTSRTCTKPICIGNGTTHKAHPTCWLAINRIRETFIAALRCLRNLRKQYQKFPYLQTDKHYILSNSAVYWIGLTGPELYTTHIQTPNSFPHLDGDLNSWSSGSLTLRMALVWMKWSLHQMLE